MNKFEDLTGRKFGRLTVVSRAENNKYNNSTWNCVCECGNEVCVIGSVLKRGLKKSCGCLWKDTVVVDLTGRRFGRLVVVEESPKRDKSKAMFWVCKCDCGTVKAINGRGLVNGTVLSCGCYGKELNRAKKTVHGDYKSITYKTWDKMIQRCTNTNVPEYKYYGARGIRVCDRWRDFRCFVEDMGERPSVRYSIDRIDVNGDYEPNNCRWATMREQANNTRRNVKFLYNGCMKTISELAEIARLGYDTMYYRLMVYRWSLDNAMTKPVTKSNSRKRY